MAFDDDDRPRSLMQDLQPEVRKVLKVRPYGET
jgi:hypothetical protein